MGSDEAQEPAAGTVTQAHVIDGSGEFNRPDVERFLAEEDVLATRTNYQVIAIMGPQSSGKSTLLNHLFGTTFQEMDAECGRQQTTKGVWMAKSPFLKDITTLVMDLEGTDGRERGEDDTNFERQSALFALATADILLLNIWCHDIGREHGSGKPLMRTVFQVNLKLFAPEPNRKKTVLLFVIRDKSRTPLEKLYAILMDDLDKMWQTISKPLQYTNSSLRDFFEVKFAALPNYEERPEEFIEDTLSMRLRFTPEGEDTVFQQADHKLPADALAVSLASIWDVIRSQKDLNLPAHKVMVANIRCKEIKDDQLRGLVEDQAWLALKAQAEAGVVPNFGQQMHRLLDSCTEGYDMEAMYFDTAVTAAKRQELVEELYRLAHPLFAGQLARVVTDSLDAFKRDLKLAVVADSKPFAAAAAAAREASLAAFRVAAAPLLVPGTPWTAEDAAGGLASYIDAHVTAAKEGKIKEVLAAATKALSQKVSSGTVSLLDSWPEGLWDHLHALLREVTGEARRSAAADLQDYGLSAGEVQALADQLQGAAEARMEQHLQDAAASRMARMRERFTLNFTLDERRTPRVWSTREDIPGAARAARWAAADVLAQLSVYRPLDGCVDAAAEAVQRSVLALARRDLDDMDATSAAPSASTSSRPPAGTPARSALQLDSVLSASDWPGVDPSHVLITPPEARATWREFMNASTATITQAQAMQEANRMAARRGPPLWALVAMMVLGWNEVMAVVWNPLLLLALLAALLFLRSLYMELDVDAAMQQGALPGAIALAGKFAPACKSVSQQTVLAVRDLFRGALASVEGAVASSSTTSSSVASSANGGAVQQASPGAAARGARGGIEQELASLTPNKEDKKGV